MDQIAEIKSAPEITFNPRSIADHQAYFPVYLHALLNTNKEKIKGNENLVGIEKTEFTFHAYDQIVKHFASENNIELPEYGDNQTITNHIFYELFNDRFDEKITNPNEMINFVNQHSDYSLLSIYSYLLINPTCPLDQIPPGYCTGIMPSKIIKYDNNITEPTQKDMETARIEIVQELYGQTNAIYNN
ncbi:MAG TPA: hypothetical protein PK639_03270 [Candidatus Woesebacteria bacterium]|nr:hypothetical protein [Candidatus Woesebacteria bacterium]